ncbi:uncharacterized protein Dvar_05030 [Desulfosarcina variabilis str. Montpellier]|uniref:hypothetical protein n=1 Tax=Desulfosarcina variabilis TaxID=2300 RepID=UPI003AFA4C2A
MKYIIYALGFAWIAAGAFAILYTDTYKSSIERLLSQVNRIWLALIPLIVGVLLLLSASSTNHGGFIALIGGLAIAKGLLIYFNPAGFFHTASAWLVNLSDQGYRLIGIIALVLGTVVISWIQ